jgi:acyl carrier protein
LAIPAHHSLPASQGLFDLGMDSLMSVELRNRLQQDSGIQLPGTLLFDYPSLNALLEFFSDEMLGKPQTAPSTASPSPLRTKPLPSALEDIEQLSDEEIDALLKTSSKSRGR